MTKQYYISVSVQTEGNNHHLDVDLIGRIGKQFNVLQEFINFTKSCFQQILEKYKSQFPKKGLWVVVEDYGYEPGDNIDEDDEDDYWDQACNTTNYYVQHFKTLDELESFVIEKKTLFDLEHLIEECFVNYRFWVSKIGNDPRYVIYDGKIFNLEKTPWFLVEDTSMYYEKYESNEPMYLTSELLYIPNGDKSFYVMEWNGLDPASKEFSKHIFRSRSQFP